MNCVKHAEKPVNLILYPTPTEVFAGPLLRTSKEGWMEGNTSALLKVWSQVSVEVDVTQPVMVCGTSTK